MPFTITVDPTAHDVLSCDQASRLLPGEPSPSRVRRWMVRGYGPSHVRLRYAKVGRRYVTNLSALVEFCRRIADAKAAEDMGPCPSRGLQRHAKRQIMMTQHIPLAMKLTALTVLLHALRPILPWVAIITVVLVIGELARPGLIRDVLTLFRK